MRVAINGFGRIGRLTMRQLSANSNIDVVAINDLGDNKTLAHLFAYDSSQGRFDADISTGDDWMRVNGKEIKMTNEPDPAKLPWKELAVDVVLECTGLFRSPETASKHIEAGAGRVIISAPAKGDIPMVVLGVNEHVLEWTCCMRSWSTPADGVGVGCAKKLAVSKSAKSS